MLLRVQQGLLQLEAIPWVVLELDEDLMQFCPIFCSHVDMCHSTESSKYLWVSDT